MIRVRTTAGQVVDLPDGAFVEITDLDGAVGRVFYQDVHKVIHSFDGNSPEAARYARMMRCKFVPLVPPPPLQ